MELGLQVLFKLHKLKNIILVKRTIEMIKTTSRE